MAHPIPMIKRPVIYISAVSRELHSSRGLLIGTLEFLGYEACFQDVLEKDHDDLRTMLRRRIDACAGLIQIVGHCYGFEPPAPDPEFGRVSYTQYEMLYARKAGKKVWLLVLDRTYPTDPHQAESPEAETLQHAYRSKILADEHIYYSLNNPDQLEAQVHKLVEHLAQLRRRAAFWAMLVVALLLLIAGGVSWLLLGQRTQLAEIINQGKGIEGILARQQQLEQALSRLALAEMRSMQQNGRLSLDQLRANAYSLLEKELSLTAGTLAKELPVFALLLYESDGTTTLQRARAAYALNRFAEAEKLFLDSALQAQGGSGDQRRKNAIDALEGAADSARAQNSNERALDHYREAQSLTDEKRDPLEWAGVQWGAGLILLFGLERAQEAEVIFRKILQIEEREHGPDDEMTLNCRNNLALALHMQNKLVEAEKEFRTGIAAQTRMLGADHPHTLASRLNRTSVLNELARYAEVEYELRDIVQIQQRRLGPEAEETLQTRMRLAFSLFSLERESEAQQLYAEVLGIQKRVFGAEHETTLSSRQNMCSRLIAMNKPEEAVHEARSLLAIQERLHGAEAGESVSCRLILGQALALLMRYEDSEKELRTVIALMRQAEAANKHVVWTARTLLASVLDAQGRHNQAELELRTLLFAQHKALGDDNLMTVASRSTLAALLVDHKKADEALIEVRAIATAMGHIFGENHPEALKHRRVLAKVLLEMGRLTEAEAEFRALVSGARPAQGEAQEEMLTDTLDLAQCLEGQSRIKEALALAENLVELSKLTPGAKNETLQQAQEMVVRLSAKKR